MSDIQSSVSVIRETISDFNPKIALVLGSGLGKVADLVNSLATISYQDLPGFPKPTVKGHAGSLTLGTIGDVPVVVLSGRQHLYEGLGTDSLKTMIRSMKELGVEVLFLTNAAGSLRQEFNVGSLVAINDHINFTGTSPIIGPNDERIGPRFLEQGMAWDDELRRRLLESASLSGVTIHEGVYAQFLGPTFETPAEVRMARILGADMVGMSTVIENIIARHCGLKCVGVSAITNLGEGMSDAKLGHEQTLEGAQMAESQMVAAVRGFVSSQPRL